MDRTWVSLETLLTRRRRTVADMLTSADGGDSGDVDSEARGPAAASTDVYRLLSDLYMQTCSVKVHHRAFYTVMNCF